MKLVFNISSVPRTITLPLYVSVDTTVDWVDASTPEYFNTPGDKSHVYTETGKVTVSISGSLDQFGNGNNWNGNASLKEVVDFCSLGLKSLYSGIFIMPIIFKACLLICQLQ